MAVLESDIKILPFFLFSSSYEEVKSNSSLLILYLIIDNEIDSASDS